jgi:hypothetical protein
MGLPEGRLVHASQTNNPSHALIRLESIMFNKQLGKIASLRFGRVTGRDEKTFGILFSLESQGWGVCAERIIYSAQDIQWLNKLLEDAKVREITDLVGIPIEATFDGCLLHSWRILTEVR